MYAINLELRGRKAVVVGGGKVAERKAAGLLEEGADVTVVSPTLTYGLLKLAEAGRLSWLKKTFSPEDLKEAFLIFAATDSREVNFAVKVSATPSQLVNIADDPALSDFQVPSMVKRGKLSIAVSTSGASPILAKKIRSQLEETFDERYEAYMEFLFSCRKAILAEVKDETKKKQLLAVITEGSFLSDKERKERFAKMLKEASE
ncbi:bifunctional precorrin-2 dehydrogenase/sirohydrochlorin ferrochelatase [Heyndrickxia sp. MSNUG]|uniref:precorrin-2 dehydrogenase/sirohydrochlorin ferrochelatase family protein n=1 Tax=Heyndrickxia sp. MSNUG TaxID=3136677 RepID=UPI003C2ADFA8